MQVSPIFVTAQMCVIKFNPIQVREIGGWVGGRGGGGLRGLLRPHAVLAITNFAAFRSVSRFEGEIDEILDSAIELSLDFGKCVMSSFEVIESGGSQGPPRLQEAKMPGVDTGNTLSKTLIKKKI